MAKKQAIGYVRVSGRSQVDGDGLRRQRLAIERLARQRKIDIVGWYVEKGVSGTLKRRPVLARMLVELEKNLDDVDLVLIEGMHRLARQLMVQESILNDIWKLGRDVLPADTGIPAREDEDPSRTMIRQIMGAVAQYEKSMVVQKLKAARERVRAREGRCEGRKPFGHFEGEAETLERIRDLRRKRKGKRLGYLKIARRLDEEGRASRSGKPWTSASVRLITRRMWPSMA